MTQGPPPSWRRRCLAAALAAVVGIAGVGVAVAGQGPAQEPPPAVAAAARSVDPAATVVEPETPEDPDSPMPLQNAPSATPPAGGTGEPAAPPALRSQRSSAPGPASIQAEASSPSFVAPPGPPTTIDPRRLFDEPVAPAREGSVDSEALPAELEAEIRACVATLLEQVESSFADQPDAERIQAVASEVVDDVLACVAGLVDVNRVLSCVSAVIQEIVAVVMAMDFTDLPQLATEFARDVVSCVAPAGAA